LSSETTARARGALPGAARALENNLPFADRAVAGLQSVLPQGYGGTGQDYATNLTSERAKNQQFAEQNPGTNLVGGITAPAPLMTIPGLGAGGGLGARIGGGAAEGFGIGDMPLNSRFLLMRRLSVHTTARRWHRSRIKGTYYTE
jgi:hypothetical protein